MKTRTKIIIALLLGAQALYDGYSFRPTYDHYSLLVMAHIHDRYEAIMNAKAGNEDPDQIALAEMQVLAKDLCADGICDKMGLPRF